MNIDCDRIGRACVNHEADWVMEVNVNGYRKD